MANYRQHLTIAGAALLLSVGTARAQTPGPNAPPEQPAPETPQAPDAEPEQKPEAAPEQTPEPGPEPTPPADQAPQQPAAPPPPKLNLDVPAEPSPASAEEEGDDAEEEGDEPDASEEEEEDASGNDTEEIVVTGSRVKRSTFAAAAAVEVIDRKQLEYSGATNLADVVQYLTVSQGSGYQGGAQATGTVSVNLRGLGTGATLVLLNGRRVVSSGGGIAFNFTDISTIPLAVVERIEILKGGASAIYGSDAVGGVINIITRKDWDGAQIEVDGQTTDRWDQQDGNASVAIGASGERARVSAALSYFRRNELLATDRDYTKGHDLSILGNPGSFGSPIPMADPQCDMARGSRSMMDSLDIGGSPIDVSYCEFDYRRFASLGGNTERVNGYAHGEYDLTWHTRMFLELNVSRMRDDAISSPSPPLLQFPTVPAGHVDNPTGMDTTFYGRALGTDAGASRIATGDDTWRTAVGLRGDLEDAATNTLFEDWEWELFATFGVSRYNNLIPDTVASAFQDALNSCDNPADLSGCFNPYYSAVEGSGTPNSQRVIDGFTGKLINLTDQTLHTYNAGLNGSLAELPGGDLGFALGAELRREFRASELDRDSNNLDFGFFLGNADAEAERDIVAGYTELVWPIYDGVEVQTAGRLENYSDVGTVANPTLGLLLTPADIAGRDRVIDELQLLVLRGHLASAFRAPTLYQTFNGFATVPDQFDTGATPAFRPVHYHGNPDLDPEEALAVSGGATWGPVRWLLLDLDYWFYDFQNAIIPENPQVVFMSGQSVVQDFDTPLDPVLFDTSGQLVRINATTTNVDESIITDGLDFGLLFKFDKKELGADVGTFSVGAQGSYTFRFDVPRFSESEGGRIPLVNDIVLADGTVLDPPTCDGDRCDVAGQLNNANAGNPVPKLKVNFPVSWTDDTHLVSLVAHFISGVDDDEHFDPDTGEYNEIDPWLSFDLMYGYTLRETVGEALTLRLGVINLLDKDPPFVDGANGFTNLLHDPRGRMLYAKLIGDF